MNAQYFPIIIILAIAVFILIALYSRKKNTGESKDKPQKGRTQTPEIIINGSYTQKWMFTYNEKDAFRKLKPIADDMGYLLFAKVRLLDLVEPKKGSKHYKALFNKIKSKHIDFVLCNTNLVAKYLIELDDSSHEREDRKERDKFVDEVVTSVGYKILHVYLHEINDSLKPRLTDE